MILALSKDGVDRFADLRLESIVVRLRSENDAKDIWKERWWIGPAGRAEALSSTRTELAEPPLEAPEFWVPVYDNGERYVREICVPDWFTSNEEPSDVLARMWPKGQFSDSELADDPRLYLTWMLSALRWNAGESPRGNPAAVRLHCVALDFLENAFLEGYKLSGAFPPRESIREDIPIVPENIARLMELSFKSGLLSARAAIHQNGVSDNARKGKKLVERQGMGRARKSSESRLDWERRTLELLSQNLKMDRRQLLGVLEQEGLVSGGKGDRWKVKGKKAAIKFESFNSQVSKLAKSLR